MLKKILLISLSIFSINICNAAVPAAVWNYQSVKLVNNTPESITFKWDSHNPSTNAPFSFISTMDPITIAGIFGTSLSDSAITRNCNELGCSKGNFQDYHSSGNSMFDSHTNSALNNPPNNRMINVLITNLINDVDATFNIIASSTTTHADLCGVTFQGDGSINVNPKSADVYRCTASVSGDGIVSFIIDPK